MQRWGKGLKSPGLTIHATYLSNSLELYIFILAHRLYMFLPILCRWHPFDPLRTHVLGAGVVRCQFGEKLGWTDGQEFHAVSLLWHVPTHRGHGRIHQKSLVCGMWLPTLDAFSRHPSTFRLLKQPHRVWNTQQAVSQMGRLKIEVVHHFAKTFWAFWSDSSLLSDSFCWKLWLWGCLNIFQILRFLSIDMVTQII